MSANSSTFLSANITTIWRSNITTIKTTLGNSIHATNRAALATAKQTTKFSTYIGSNGTAICSTLIGTCLFFSVKCICKFKMGTRVYC